MKMFMHAAEAIAATEAGVAPANMQTAPEECLATENCEPRMACFEVGVVYATRSICDYECIFRWVVTRRTEKSIWLAKCDADGTAIGPEKRRAVSEGYRGGYEMCYPSGKYSMCPVLTADKPHD